MERGHSLPQGLTKRIPALEWLPRYRRASLRPDLIAALTLWAFLVPQAIAYASIAGLPPQAGLFAAFAALVDVLSALDRDLQRQGKSLVFANVHAKARDLLARGWANEEPVEGRIHRTLEDAMRRMEPEQPEP